MIQRQILAVTGASGADYALRLIWHLAQLEGETDLIFSPGFFKVLAAESETTFPELNWPALERFISDQFGPMILRHRFSISDYTNIGARAASGSADYTAMVVVPCSMNTLASIAHGLSQNLIERAADVCLKERRKLILCPRETPFSTIHLRNMLSLSEAGATIMPLMPGYYNRPATMVDLQDFMVDRILKHLGYNHRTTTPWGS
jgi:flavin prenyltransferase